ncbi:MAG: hypothetical protein PHG65_02305, partial [Kiritimatiellae bacterium]|nr:hypothetical protein [Kiritimatiellia bacterium]
VKPPPRPRRSFGRRLLGAIGWTCCIAVILYAAAQALSRTAGFRSLLADRLSDRLGIPLTIGGSRMDVRLNLTLEDIMTELEQGVVAPEVAAERVEIRWNWGREPELGLIRFLTVDGGLVRLVQDGDGSWAPACLAPLADKVSRLGQLGMLNGFLNRDTADAVEEDSEADGEAESAEGESGRAALGGLNVIIRNAEVSWWSGDREVASIEGLDFLSRQVEFPGRRVQYYQVKANEAGVAGGRRMQNISFEMLSTAGRNIVLGPKASLHAVETEAQPPPRTEEALSLQESELLAHAQSAIERSREPEGAAVPSRPPAPVMEVPTATPWPTATLRPTATPPPMPTATPVPKPVVRSWPTVPPVPTAVSRRIPQQEIRPTPTVIPDPMEQAMEAFAAAQRLTNAPGAEAAPEGLSDDESEALIRYIKEMLESGN